VDTGLLPHYLHVSVIGLNTIQGAWLLPQADNQADNQVDFQERSLRDHPLFLHAARR
jgi:hypothetical protein